MNTAPTFGSSGFYVEIVTGTGHIHRERFDSLRPAMRYAAAARREGMRRAVPICRATGATA